jgi:mono/diheme cytochrome c family protein
LILALLSLGGGSGCSQRSTAQPIPPVGNLTPRSFAPTDIGGEARRAISERIAKRERQYRELYEPGSIWNELRIEQRDIDSRRIALPRLIEIGRELFASDFPLEQGLGNGLAASQAPMAGKRPAPNLRHVHYRDFGGPDGTRCIGCHHIGGAGGAGFRADNSFIDGDGDQPQSGLERNPRPLFGAALLQRLGEEMTVELQAQVRSGIKKLRAGESLPLSAKGLSFGVLKRGKNGKLDFSSVRGVSLDFIVRPFGWKGTGNSLRQLVVTSLQQNLGVQAEELVKRLGASGHIGGGPSEDPDADGVKREATEGMVTAMTAYVAALTPSSEDLLIAPNFSLQLARGQKLFHSLGCAGCHTPELPLNDPVLRLGPQEHSQPVVDLSPLLASSTASGQRPLTVRIYSDLRRHNMGDELADSRGYLGIPRNLWLTPPLWGISSTGPYLHDGRAGDIESAILAHGGEASAARDAYAKLQVADSEPLRMFLLSLNRPAQVEFKP